MTGLNIGFLLVGAAASTAVLIRVLLETGLAWKLAVDAPNARSLHSRPTPRIGGVVLIAVALIPGCLFGLYPTRILLLAGALSLFSFLDDRVGLPVRVRLPFHFLASAAFLFPFFESDPVVIAELGFALFALVWMINLFNFMDGSDGLAGGMTAFGFLSYSAASWMSGDATLAAGCAAVAGSAIGFLVLNFHPAKVFLGDAGSIAIGFLAGSIGIWGIANSLWPAWYPPLVFAPFILDATFTLFIRAARGERLSQAHREHLYQRMILAGVNHRRTALAYYAIMLGNAILAPLLLRASTRVQWEIVVALAVAYPVAYSVIRKSVVKRSP
jgi:UDP-N-acetylmuramyl pentapeptide phosphotransferase/UDP-N-acetylglucosamine-1-phosphate transferase